MSKLSILSRRRKKSVIDTLVRLLLLFTSSISVFVIIIILYSLVSEAFLFFTQVSILDFLVGTKWSVFFEDKSFGILPLLAGTILTSFIALVFAIPIGVGSAIFLSEYASKTLRSILKPVLEVLAGIPTIVYGYFALTFITPNLQYYLSDLSTYNALSAGIAIGIMITPTIASLCEDAFYSVPQMLKAAGYALGARKSQVVLRIVIPYTLSAIFATIILAMGRAIGETMIVVIAAGLRPTLTLNPFESVMTMTAAIAQAATGETPRGTIEYYSLFAVGTYLFIIVVILNLISYYIKKRFELRYES